MPASRQVVFIQGGGAGTHDDWDAKLVDSLRDELGEGYEYLAEASPARRLGAIMLIAAPFVGAGGWPGEDFELPLDLGARLPRGVSVHLFHGLSDHTASPDHIDLYSRAIPQAYLHRLPHRDHHLNDDLSEVAQAIAYDHRDGAL